MQRNILMNRKGFHVMTTELLLTREALKQRWGVGLRMIDRLRAANKLPWVDISGARGGRPTVRFLLRDVLEFEKLQRHGATAQDGAAPDVE